MDKFRNPQFLQKFFGGLIGLSALAILFQNCGEGLPSIDDTASAQNASLVKNEPNLGSPNVLPSNPNVPVNNQPTIKRAGTVNLVNNGDFTGGIGNFTDLDPWIKAGAQHHYWVKWDSSPTLVNKTKWGLIQSSNGSAMLATCITPPCNEAHNSIFMDIPRGAIPTGQQVRFGASVRGSTGRATGTVVVTMIPPTRDSTLAAHAVPILTYQAGFDSVAGAMNMVDGTGYLRFHIYPKEGELIVDDVWLEY